MLGTKELERQISRAEEQYSRVYLDYPRPDRLRDQMEDLWTHAYLYHLSPIVLLEFLTEHIKRGALRAIYKVIQENYHIGRSVPKLLRHSKNRYNREIQRQCVRAAEALINNDPDAFAKETAKMFHDTRYFIIGECKRLKYWQPAMRVYDGSLLWK